MLMFGHGNHKVPFFQMRGIRASSQCIGKTKVPSPGTSSLRITKISNGNLLRNICYFSHSRNTMHRISYYGKWERFFFLLIDRHQHDAKTNPPRGCLNLCDDLGHFSFPLILSISSVAYHVKSIWCSRSFCIHNRT